MRPWIHQVGPSNIVAGIGKRGTGGAHSPHLLAVPYHGRIGPHLLSKVRHPVVSVLFLPWAMPEQRVVAVPPRVTPALVVAGMPRKAVQLAEDAAGAERSEERSEEGAEDAEVAEGTGGTEGAEYSPTNM
jgi:hypothetical protein